MNHYKVLIWAARLDIKRMSRLAGVQASTFETTEYEVHCHSYSIQYVKFQYYDTIRYGTVSHDGVYIPSLWCTVMGT